MVGRDSPSMSVTADGLYCANVPQCAVSHTPISQGVSEAQTRRLGPPRASHFCNDVFVHVHEDEYFFRWIWFLRRSPYLAWS